MNNTAGKELTPEMHAWFEVWKTCTQNVLSQVSGQPITFEVSTEPCVAAEDSDLFFTVVSNGAVHGEMAVRLPIASAVRLAQKVLGEAEPAAALLPEHKEALEELLRQIGGLAATSLASSAGGEVQFHISSSAAPSWPSAITICLRTRDEAGTPVAIEIHASAGLVSALVTKPQSPCPELNPEAAPDSPLAASYERLMDVSLDVKLRFGSRRMVLRDVLALSAGAVVELDRNLQAPADLLLAGRVIAQGEVVVVDGKYGLRITDVFDSRCAS